jgi:methionyl-tRNA synthetase
MANSTIQFNLSNWEMERFIRDAIAVRIREKFEQKLVNNLESDLTAMCSKAIAEEVARVTSDPQWMEAFRAKVAQLVDQELASMALHLARGQVAALMDRYSAFFHVQIPRSDR